MVLCSVNVGGLKNIIQAVKSSKNIGKVVYTSSFFALGPTNADDVVDESQVHSRKCYCTEYERSKVEADDIAHEAAKDFPLVIVYPGVIYGPGKLTRGNIVTEILVEHLSGRLPGFIGNGEDRFSYSHVDDVAYGHVAALEKGTPGEKYLLTGENASFVDVFQIVASLTGAKAPQWHIPFWILTICGYLLEIWARISGKPPLISTPVVKVLKRKWAYTCVKAKKELGYNPRPLKEGLAQLLMHLREEGFLRN
ncbi:hypothetical protein O6H91_Y568500 [Diphasiastrum complanatum]|nr:hypothetical protein O6H91_Y568500 [Diphasiastrum complanatum]